MYHAHDGFLEILLELGVVGLVYIGTMLLTGLVVSMRRRLIGGGAETLWAFATTLALLVSNVTEAPSTSFFGWLVLGCVLVVVVPPMTSRNTYYSELAAPIGLIDVRG